MTNKRFLIDGVIGNSRLLASLTRNGELQRLFWPHIDGPQHVTRLVGGVSLNGEPVCWQDAPDWAHQQAYEPDQNLLVTRSRHPRGLEVTTTDAAVPGEDLVVRHLRLTNCAAAPVALRYVLYQWVQVDENPLYNTALFDEGADGLLHYRRQTFVLVGADRPVTTYLIDRPAAAWQSANQLSFRGGYPLHGDVAGALLWDLGQLGPGDSAELTLFIGLGRSRREAADLVVRARQRGAQALLEATRAYWRRWLERARPLRVATAEAAERIPQLAGLPAVPASPAVIEALYRRSLLLFKLMADEQSGAVIAAPEFDPTFSSCGGYGYCWGRDAAYVTTAMDLAGYHDLADGFYRWALTAQEPEGWWMHRQHAGGEWGPSWGLLQVDETGSILYGMALHARLHGGETFIRSVWESVARAADWLIGFLDPETGLPGASFDLWEERVGQHTYSAGAVFAGLTAAAEMATAIGQTAQAERYAAAAERLRAAILKECVREGRFLRGRWLRVSEERYRKAVAAGAAGRVGAGPKGHPVFALDEDPVPDTSLLALSTPFGVVNHENPVMAETAAALVKALWRGPIGGMMRYAGDHYRGGNPWILCTLWLGQYEAARGSRELARQTLDWAVARQNGAGLLAEQVDPKTGEPVWVVPLTWSHAMYVLLALQLYGA